MPAKKNSRSALYYFAKERMEAGKTSPSLKSAIEEVYPEWKCMSAVEKQPYEQLYKEYKESLKLEKEYEVPIVKSEFEINNKNTSSNELRKVFNNLINKSKSSSESAKDLAKEQKWYFVKFQTFCKSDVNPLEQNGFNSDTYYVLGEVGAAEYSLAEGITNQYHAFIKPNKIPLGYRSQCMDSSRDIHQIPLDGFDLINKDYEEIYKDLEQFFRPKADNNYFVPIFSMAKDIDETKFGFNYLRFESNSISKSGFYENIYDLENLFVELAYLCDSDVSYNAARDLLTSYSFDYSFNSRCFYHEELGISNCALGHAKRAAYHISDSLCISYDVRITDKHLPVEKPVAVPVYNDSFRTKDSFNKFHSKNSSFSNSNSNRGYNKRPHENNQSISSESAIFSNSTTDQTARFSSIDIRYKTQEKTNQTSNKPTSSRRLVADAFESNIAAHNQKLLEENENQTLKDEEWDLVDKRSKRPLVNKNFDDSSVVSEKSASEISSTVATSVFSDSTTKTSSSSKYMGRGRAFMKS